MKVWCVKIIQSFNKEKEIKPITRGNIVLQKDDVLVLVWDLDNNNMDLDVVQSYTKMMQNILPNQTIVSVPNTVQFLSINTTN